MKKNDTMFTENQFLIKTWVGKLLFAVLIILVIALFYFYNNNDFNYFSFSIQFITFLAVFILSVSNLKTHINIDEITIQYFPYHFSKVKYKKIEIDKVEIVTFDPLSDFGGWGIKSNLKIKCFTVSGNKGILITLKSGKKRLIGISKYDLVENALIKYNFKYEKK